MLKVNEMDIKLKQDNPIHVLLMAAIDAVLQNYPGLKTERFNLESEGAILITREGQVYYPEESVMNQINEINSATPDKTEFQDENSLASDPEPEPESLKPAEVKDTIVIKKELPDYEENLESDENFHLNLTSIKEESQREFEHTLPETPDLSITEMRLLNCIVNPVRVIITLNSLKASLQLFNKEIDQIGPVFYFDPEQQMWQIEGKLCEMLKKLYCPDHYTICCGLPIKDLIKDGDIRTVPTNVVVSHYPFLRINSLRCVAINKKRSANRVDERDNEERCKRCRAWLYRKNLISTKELDGNDSRISCTDTSSRHTFTRLTPKEISIRIANMTRERKKLLSTVAHLKSKLAKLS